MAKNLFFLILSSVLISCSTNNLEIQKDDKFKVTVTSNGEKVSAHESGLIQRVEFTKTEFEGVKKTIKDGQVFGISAEKDLNGKVSGLKILTLKERVLAKRLGLERGDIIVSAIYSDSEDKADLSGKSPLYDSFSRLSDERSLSISILRGGVPHKIYYFLN